MKNSGGTVEFTISFEIKKNPVFRIFDSEGNELKRGGKNSTTGEEIFKESLSISAYRITDDCCEIPIGPFCYKVKCSTGQRIPGPCPCP